MQEIEKTVRQFIVDNYLFGNEDDAPAPEDSFLKLRLMDSTGVLELVQFLEDTFDVTVDDTELVPENLDSIALITGFVHRKGQAA